MEGLGLENAFLLPSFSVQINCYPTRLFKTSTGLRQGDPLSSFLFTLVAEPLGLMLEKAKDIGLIEGFEVGHNGEAIAHLHFADNTTIFSFCGRQEVANLKEDFKAFSGGFRFKRLTFQEVWSWVWGVPRRLFSL